MEIDVAEIPPLAGFTGKKLDSETSLYHFGVRYYPQDPSDDSWSCTWLSVDPPANNYPRWSSYDYVQDDAADLTHRTGKRAWSAEMWGGGKTTALMWFVNPHNAGAGRGPNTLDSRNYSEDLLGLPY